MRKPVIAVFDVGKTNKKLFLFDEQYAIVYEKSARFIETKDEDGFACENLQSLRQSVFDSLDVVFRDTRFTIKAIAFSTYGASLVYVDYDGKPLAPLYNYLKPFPEKLAEKFYREYGGEEKIAAETASPVLGNLNSGMQIYRIKEEKPELFAQIRYALHLPQFMSSLVSKTFCSDMTSIGCHTALWDFDRNDYHDWVIAEKIEAKMAPVCASDSVFQAKVQGQNLPVGVGLHDSSAALIPYLRQFDEPFVLLSTGTWSIALNPFNHSPLTVHDLRQDCLSYFSFEGKPVKASRLFAGNEHEQQVKRIAAYFKTSTAKYRSMPFSPRFLSDGAFSGVKKASEYQAESLFGARDLSAFSSDEEAYHQLVADLVSQQLFSLELTIRDAPVKQIFVDGGFSRNQIYMTLLARSLPGIRVFAASVPQATALGAALAIHKHWNSRESMPDVVRVIENAG
ncbi:MAG: carbohydrate kinase [Mucilaginibacter polytrichastri]|nr:carbohydrate kinase [Mucilaginibacter polytrichastri]